MSAAGRILCLFGRHCYRRIARVTPSCDHIDCVRCGRQWAMNHELRGLLPWSDMAGFYAEQYGYQAEEVFSLRSPTPVLAREGR